MFRFSIDDLSKSLVAFDGKEVELSSNPEEGRAGSTTTVIDDAHGLSRGRRHSDEDKEVHLIAAIRAGVGLSRYYGKTGNVDWKELLICYVRCVWGQSREAKPFYYAAHDYVEHVVYKGRDEIGLLQPLHYPYYRNEEFPYRETLINSHGVFLLGSQLLDVVTTRHHSLGYRIAETIFSAPRLRNRLNDLEVGSPGGTGQSLGDALAALGVDKIEGIVREAWEPTAALFDIGRHWDEEKRESLKKRVLSLTPFGMAFDEVLSVRGQGDLRESAVAECSKFAFLAEGKIPIDSSESLIKAFLVCDAWKICENCLRKLPTDPSVLQQAWGENPLAVLLAMSILMLELPARLCWASGLNNVEQWSSCLVISDFTYDETTVPPSLLYFFETSLRIREDSPRPIDGWRLVAARHAFGDQVFALLDSRIAMTMEAFWSPTAADATDSAASDVGAIKVNLERLAKLDSTLNEYISSIIEIAEDDIQAHLSALAKYVRERLDIQDVQPSVMSKIQKWLLDLLKAYGTRIEPIPSILANLVEIFKDPVADEIH